MAIPFINSASQSDVFDPQIEVDKIKTKCQIFADAVFKNLALNKLKHWANTYRRDLEQSIIVFFKKKVVFTEPKELFNEQVDILTFIYRLKNVYLEMGEQERKYLIRFIRFLGEHRIFAASAFTATLFLTAFTAATFGITPVFHNEILIAVFSGSGVVGIIVFAVFTGAFELCRRYYEKVKIGEYDLKEREFFSNYFDNFGQKNFHICKKLVSKMDPNLHHSIEFKLRENLFELADLCLQVQKLDEEAKQHENERGEEEFENFPPQRLMSLNKFSYADYSQNCFEASERSVSSEPEMFSEPMTILKRLKKQISVAKKSQPDSNTPRYFPTLHSQGSQYFPSYVLEEEEQPQESQNNNQNQQVDIQGLQPNHIQMSSDDKEKSLLPL